MKKCLAFIFLCWLVSNVNAQAPESYYDDAFERIDYMLTGKSAFDFKKTAFLTENAYFENQLNPKAFNNCIQF